jgi:predicted Rossmann fold nucleotide-binding protein DprA/Smf involved in DNA uptake
LRIFKVTIIRALEIALISSFVILGNIDLKTKMISIVGTQITRMEPSSAVLIEDLAPRYPVIVRWFYGVDIVAHQLAMEYKLQTIGVVAHGLNQIYPKPKKYVAKMEENGGFMTEFWSASNPDKENFVRRNRIRCWYDRSNHSNRVSRSRWLFNNGKLGQ